MHAAHCNIGCMHYGRNAVAPLLLFAGCDNGQYNVLEHTAHASTRPLTQGIDVLSRIARGVVCGMLHNLLQVNGFLLLSAIRYSPQILR